MGNLKIQSDFIDYYDSLSSDNTSLIYRRLRSQCKQRGTALKFLKNMGLKTLDIKQVSQFYRDTNYLCVYTNPKSHDSNGKVVMALDDARLNYPNYIASEYIGLSKTNGLTLKYLQIGKRRFTLFFKKEDELSLHMGQLIDIKESQSDYNRLVGLPIFSIDYISNGTEMIATDFNEVEDLQRIGINYYLSKETIIDEIIDALMIYNLN